MSDPEDEAERRLLDRLEPHPSSRRDEPRGAWAFAAKQPLRAQGVLDRNEARSARAGDRKNNAGGSLDPVRDIRYFSGPWEGAGPELMPVSWFLLWRSNVSWVPDPAYLKKEASGRGKLAGRSEREPTSIPQRTRPADFKIRPAGSRTTPRDAQASRAKPSKEE